MYTYNTKLITPLTPGVNHKGQLNDIKPWKPAACGRRPAPHWARSAVWASVRKNNDLGWARLRAYRKAQMKNTPGAYAGGPRLNRRGLKRNKKLYNPS
jgi:hypothetical protein